MPPEVFQWDRRSFRRYDRPGSNPAFWGGFSGGGRGPTRWRDQHHPQPLPPPSHPYHHHQHGSYSGFRSRPPPPPPPPGLGKQGGQNMYQEESSHVFPPFGSQFSDRISDDMNYRPPNFRIDGRYFRHNREMRGSFSHKVLKDHSWEPTSSQCGPRRPINDVNEQSSVENVKSYNYGSNNSNGSNKSSFHPLPDSINLLGQSESLLKEKHDKNGASTERAYKGHKLEKENPLESIDCKSLKRTQLRSLSSRGSGFSLSSTFKSVGTNSNDTVLQVQPKITMPVQSPSGDAVACPISATMASSEDNSSRKKPCLQWGEGLKKFEKKNGATRNGFVISDSDTEVVQSDAVNLADESPKAAALLDCVSPATSSSVVCSSSPGVQEKQSIKAVSFDHDKTNFSYSPSGLSQMQCEGPSFSLENLELTSIANLSSSISEFLTPDYPHSVDSGFVQTTAMNKLLLWKVDVLKALEMIESNINSLDTEMKTSISEVGSSFPYPAASCLLPGDKILENITEELDNANTVVKEEDIDNSESAISKFVEMPSASAEDFCPSERANHIEGFLNSDVNDSKNLEVNCLENSLNDEETKGRVDDSEPILSSNYPTLASCSNSCCGSEDIYDLILATNKDSADRASEVLNKLLPANLCHFDISTAAGVSYLPSDSMIMKKKFLTRKQFVQFNEKVTTLKFKVFHHFWKENQLLPVRRVPLKSHKKDRNWTDYFGYRKHHSCPSRFSSAVFAKGNLSLVPTEEGIDFVSRLLSNFKLRLYRNTLKMPVLILDKKEKFISRFISSNGLVEDPLTVEKERSMINIWTSEEREIFVDKLATFGKDFSKIAYFLDHKTTADCIEFYYKNHRSEYFEKSKMGFPNQRKTRSGGTYLVASGKRWNREANAASLDVLGSASAVAVSADSGIEIQQKCTSRFSHGLSAYRESRGDIGSLQRSNNLDIKVNDRETLAVDVLAGVCSSLSHKAMNSCITSSVDPAEICEELYDSCLDESCEEMDTTDWTDEEKSFFIQAVSSYGKDFEMISQCVRTRSIYECKVFFSKTHKCLGLDMLQPRPSNAVSGDATGGVSDDSEDTCVVESETIICCERSGCEMGENLLSPDLNTSCESDIVGIPTLKPHLNECEENNGTGFDDFMDAEKSGTDLCQEKDKAGLDFDTDANEQRTNCGTLDVSCDTESLRVIEEAENHVQSNRLGETQNAASIEISDGHRRPGVSSHPCGDAHSSTQLDISLGCQKKTFNHNASSAARAIATSDVQCQKIARTGNCQHRLSCRSFSDRVESSQILGDLKVSMSTVKEKNVGISCEKEVSLQSDAKVDGNFPLDQSSRFSLQKCNSLRFQTSSEAPTPLQEQTRDYCRKGGVKLFGQILISSQGKQNSSIPPNDKKMHHPKSGKQSFSGNQTINLNSTQAKFDCVDYPSCENIPITNFRSWDANKFQNAFPPFPDSTLLLHQNPAAVIMPLDKLKQPLLHQVVKSFPIPGLSSCNRVADYDDPRKGEVRPFTVDLEMQRTRSCSNVMSGTQQPKKGMVVHTGVSDPVEAIKLYYAKS
ncbi:Nuclear receptor coregulator SMRT SMRTER [Olea europaea subsp. europaea]|uniref:Nuclear receptor coregulator SMRT SMRTER n=3 Tax=Olea europaea subsp. europaea TaxID=158383 RepID=A0A8S0PPU9_OLEEU|nr:Nuclear receptor coregulator SMRT SMRTER [Olea europaea subsp. europaea]